MLETLEQIDWISYTQYRGASATRIPEAMRALEAVHDAPSQERAYNDLLFALGNNHAGTYYPVAVAVVPFLGELLRSERAPTRKVALDVLLDLTGSFAPEPGFERSCEADGGTTSLRLLLVQAVLALRPQLEALVAAMDPTEGLAHELLSQGRVDEQLLRLGLRPHGAALNEVRVVLAAQTVLEESGQGRGDTQWMRLCAVQLFSAGRLEDVLPIAQAMTASMDAHGAMRLEFLCGAGLNETLLFLAGRREPVAERAREELLEWAALGEFEEFSREGVLLQEEQYYGL